MPQSISQVEKGVDSPEVGGPNLNAFQPAPPTQDERIYDLSNKIISAIDHPPLENDKSEALAAKNITVQEGTPSTVEQTVRKKIESMEEITDRLFTRWNELEKLKLSALPGGHERKVVQAQIDALIDEYLICVCSCFDRIHLDDIFVMREAIKSAVQSRSEALRDKKSLITVIVTSVVAIGCSAFSFFPGGTLGMSATTVKGISNTGTAVSTSGGLVKGYMDSETQAKVGLHEYDQQFNQSVERDRNEARQKQDTMRRQLIDERRTKFNTEHQTWESLTSKG